MEDTELLKTEIDRYDRLAEILRLRDELDRGLDSRRPPMRRRHWPKHW